MIYSLKLKDTKEISMAKIFPSLEEIKKLKVQPTKGESYLLNYLIKNLAEEIEIYFQPFLNGDMPDIILMQKNIGVAIIEVKDWNLSLYKVDEKNNWFLKKKNTSIKSPFQQVYSYRDNLFNLHINGLLKTKVLNPHFFGRIKTYVYFHNASKNDNQSFYKQIFDDYKNEEQKYHDDFKSKELQYTEYIKKLDSVKKRKSNIEQDVRYSMIGNDNIAKIMLPLDTSNLFTESIYKEFHRYLQPPTHTFEQGIEFKYTKKQNKLIESKFIHQKIKGVAGSGKTVVLAKRAVNAHKRHDGRVLILSYNITLGRYIHDRISDVREEFNWGNFYITNYHQCVKQLLNNIGVKIEIPENIQNIINSISDDEEKEIYIDNYFEEKYFSNSKLFESHKDEIHKYKSIFVDEIQDYKTEWIKIIRAYFLEEDGEMVLFGDEKQNIYDRELDTEKKIKIVQGFGTWEALNKSIRHKNDGRILSLAKHFQKTFFTGKYEIDRDEESLRTPSLSLDLYKVQHYQKDKYDTDTNLEKLVESIFNELQSYHIHQDDIVILGSKISFLKQIDYLFRTKYKIKTLTTFEAKEIEKTNKNDMLNIRKFKKIAFNNHSGKLKISTIHSFKGYEADVVFLIVDEGNKYEKLDDNPEMIYAGITRSKSDIMVFTKKDSKYNEFFYKELEHKKEAYMYNKKDVEKLKILSLDDESKLFYSYISA